MAIKEVVITGNNLTVDQVHAVARGKAKVKIAPAAMKAVKANRQIIEKKVKDGVAIYGVTTGIGEFARIQISPEQGEQLQKNIVYSHAAAVGPESPEDETRAAMLLRINTLCKGYSAVRPLIPETMLKMVNKRVTPVVYKKGSLGTCGDLAPHSQIAEVVMGEGKAYFSGRKLNGATALKNAGIKPVNLSYKEGLGIINGTEMFTGVGVLAIHDAINVIKNFLVAAGMTIDCVQSSVACFDPRVHQIRNHKGQIRVAEIIRKLIKGSKTIAANKGKVQDAYSLRCTPQIVGPTLDALKYALDVHVSEMNGVTDNPLFFTKDDEYLAAGNFHGQPVAMAQDFLSIAMAEIGDIAERHTNRMMNPALSALPDFLVEGKGLNSGLMVAQYSQAALIGENRVLAHPAVTDNVSVSADQEDHVCMGSVTSNKLKDIVRNTEIIVAIQLMSAAQALDFRRPLKGGKGTEAAYKEIRKGVKKLVDDRSLYPDIDVVVEMVRDGRIVAAVEKTIGEIRVLP